MSADVVAYRIGPARGPRRLRPQLVAVRLVDVAQAMEQHALRVPGRATFTEQDGIEADTVAAFERLVARHPRRPVEVVA
jgi:hypothetical protein